MHTLVIQLTTRELATAFIATYGETAKSDWHNVKKFAEELTIDDIMKTVLDTIRDYGVDKQRKFIQADETGALVDRIEKIFQKRFD